MFNLKTIKIDELKKIWVLYSSDAVDFCNASFQEKVSGSQTDLLSFGLFEEMIDIARQQSLEFCLIGGDKIIEDKYLSLLGQVKGLLVIPAEKQNAYKYENCLCILDSNQADSVCFEEKNIKIHLRLRKKDIGKLSGIVSRYFDICSSITIRHPDILTYQDSDFDHYKSELNKISDVLLDDGRFWKNELQLDFFSTTLDQDTDKYECGAGVNSLAINPKGEVSFCPSAFDSGVIYGDVGYGINLPNQELFTREFSVPCSKCTAIHCNRCRYINKIGTSEYCVPPKNLCVLFHIENETKIKFLQKAKNRGLLDSGYLIPELPNILDPFELVKAEDSFLPVYYWRRLLCFTGKRQDITPNIMFDILLHIKGWIKALRECGQAGVFPNGKIFEEDMLCLLRQKSIEQYRNFRFDDVVTVNQVEMSLIEAGESIGELRTSTRDSGLENTRSAQSVR